VLLDLGLVLDGIMVLMYAGVVVRSVIRKMSPGWGSRPASATTHAGLSGSCEPSSWAAQKQPVSPPILERFVRYGSANSRLRKLVRVPQVVYRFGGTRAACSAVMVSQAALVCRWSKAGVPTTLGATLGRQSRITFLRFSLSASNFAPSR
jgi:hypothetical protein